MPSVINGTYYICGPKLILASIMLFYDAVVKQKMLPLQFHASPTSSKLFSETPQQKIPQRSRDYLESVHPKGRGRHCHCGEFDHAHKTEQDEYIVNDQMLYKPYGSQSSKSFKIDTTSRAPTLPSNERIQDMLRLISKMKTKYCDCPSYGPKNLIAEPRNNRHQRPSVSKHESSRSPTRIEFNQDMSRALRQFKY